VIAQEEDIPSDGRDPVGEREIDALDGADNTSQASLDPLPSHSPSPLPEASREPSEHL
jgi:hypothetical protein